MRILSLTLLFFCSCIKPEAIPLTGLEPGVQISGFRGAEALSPSLGPAEAPVVVFVFADFTCSHCRDLSPAILALHDEYPKEVRIVFKHFPAGSDVSVLAAKAAVSAQLQGKFWEMFEALFNESRPLTREIIGDIAQNIGLDVPRFEIDRKREETAALIRGDEKLGRNWGIRGTPTVVVNGTVVTGEVSRAKIAGYVEYFLQHPAYARGGKNAAARGKL